MFRLKIVIAAANSEIGRVRTKRDKAAVVDSHQQNKKSTAALCGLLLCSLIAGCADSGDANTITPRSVRSYLLPPADSSFRLTSRKTSSFDRTEKRSELS